MSSFLRLALVLGTLCSVRAYQGNGWWLQQPYEEDSEFTLKAEYGKDYILNCTGDFDVDFWVLPDMQIIDGNSEPAEYLSLDGTSYTEWINEGKALNISLVVEDQFGFYFCHGTDAAGNRMVVKRALNYQGPYFADLWDVYRMNTIVACSSAAAFLVIVGVSYCVYEWKFSDDDDREEEESQPPYHINGAYDADTAPKVAPMGASAIPMDSTML